MEYLPVGAILPISVQMYDQNTTRTIRARIFNHLSEPITGYISLPHVSLGFYKPVAPSVMPDVDSVQIVYEVMSGATILISATETITRAPYEITQNGFRGTLDAKELSARVSLKELKGIIKNENL